MATETTANATLPQRAMHELKEFAIVFLYLYVTLGAVILMKTAVLHAQGIEFAFWGIAAVKAAVLAKFMLVGNAMKIGQHKSTSPLIWPTLHKATSFAVLLILLTAIEEVVVGLLHHKPIAVSLGELVGPRLEETTASIVIILLVLIPYFAFQILNAALGDDRLVRMFFIQREPIVQK